MALIDRIKFDGLRSRDWLIYKYPGESFVTGSQLIVGEGQIAIFVIGGQVCDIFTPGTHTLATKNIPLLQSFMNLPFGGKTPFTAEIYYINTVSKLNINWGTTDPIQLIDPKYYVRLHIRAFGQFSIKIENYHRFFTELIGSMSKREIVDYDKIKEYFKGILVTKIKTIISSIIIDHKISALELTPHLEDISEEALVSLKDDFLNYGISILAFHIQSINFPNEDFDQINKLLQDKAAFEIIGEDRYTTKRTFDVYEGAAKNASGNTSTLIAHGIGLYAGQQMGTTIGSMASAKQSNAGAKNCPHCNTSLPTDAKFCSQCGTPIGAKSCSCGAILPATAKFCTECGKAI